MKLRSEQYEFLKGEVVYLFERHDIRCIPINGFELAYKMRITLIPYSAITRNKRNAAKSISKDGFYFEDLQGKDFIYYNDNSPYKRMNMTILHEIAHCVLDHNGESEEEEAEANFFAKYAAAPPPLVHLIRPQSAKHIEEVFCLSYTAAVNAFNYYHKWLEYSGNCYKNYEIRMLRLFQAS